MFNYMFKMRSVHTKFCQFIFWVSFDSELNSYLYREKKMESKFFAVLCCVLFSTSLGKEVLDSRLEDLELLRLPALLNVSLTSERGLRETNTLFKWRYRHFSIQIEHDLRGIYTWNNEMYVHYEIAEKFLKAFGKSFEKLSVAYNLIPLNKHQEIGAHINEYCSDSLVEFKAKHVTEGAFNNMTNPFTKVKHVAIDGVWKDIDSNAFDLDELFPKMKVLNLTYAGGYILDRVFPNLEELNADIEPSPRLANFLQRNSHIKKLRLKSTSVEVLRAVSKLSKLDSVGFHVPDDLKSYKDDPVIQFEHITDVAIADLNRHIKSGKITFKQLKKLHLTVAEQLDDVWIDFIGQNKDLETLIVTGGNLNNSTFFKLASKVDKLVEADVRCNFGLDIESIVKFLESKTNMKTVTLRFPKGSVPYFNDLADKLSSTENLKDFEVAPVDMRFDSIQITKTLSPNAASHIFASSTLTVSLIVVCVNVFAF